MAKAHRKEVHRNIAKRQEKWEQRYNALTLSARVGIAFAAYKIYTMIVLTFGIRPVDAEAQMLGNLFQLLTTLTLAASAALIARHCSTRYGRINSSLPLRLRSDEPDLKFWK